MDKALLYQHIDHYLNHHHNHLMSHHINTVDTTVDTTSGLVWAGILTTSPAEVVDESCGPSRMSKQKHLG